MSFALKFFMAAAVCLTLVLLSVGGEAARAESELVIERVSTKVPFPRGLEIVDGQLYVLSRGRVRESGGASGSIDDRAGTIYRIDLSIAQPIDEPLSDQVRENGEEFAAPTDPPFRLLRRELEPATRDRETDRPYCVLRFDAKTQSFYICAFSGIDKAERPGERNFSKNLSDAVLRFDLRTRKWYEVERHHIEAGGIYPHHDVRSRPPPHGWLNGPDNCLVVGDWLYVVAKDNSKLVRYDLRAIQRDPEAGPPPSYFVLDENIFVKGLGMQRYLGHSMLAERNGWLYIGYRTTSEIVRIQLDRQGLPVQPIEAELLARFDPWDPAKRTSANLTDMAFDQQGRLYVVSAQPSRVYRFTPDPKRVFDARDGKQPPWADLSQLTGNRYMKSENVLVDQADRVYVTSGDAYGHDSGLGGVVYRITERQ
jgi:hypothetical protein